MNLGSLRTVWIYTAYERWARQLIARVSDVLDELDERLNPEHVHVKRGY
jgi:hypothetical protein